MWSRTRSAAAAEIGPGACGIARPSIEGRELGPIGERTMQAADLLRQDIRAALDAG